MLVLSRKAGEAVLIDGQITVRVEAVKGGRVRLSFDAPREVAITRSELVDQIDERPSLPPPVFDPESSNPSISILPC